MKSELTNSQSVGKSKYGSTPTHLEKTVAGTKANLQRLHRLGQKKFGTVSNEQKRACNKCGRDLVMEKETSGPWGTMWRCPEHGTVSAQDIVYNDRPPTEQELMKIHVEEQHGGKMKDCPKCEKIILGNDAGDMRQELVQKYGKEIARGFISPQASDLAEAIKKLTGKSTIQIFEDARKDAAGLENDASDKCTCGDTGGEHEYGTGACLSCSNCKQFKRAKAENTDPRDRTECPKGSGGEGCDWVQTKETPEAYYFTCKRCGRVVTVPK